MNYLNLPYPHGFLIWRGKQTAIANNELLEGNKYLIVTDDDAFGEATLGKPSAMTIEKFEQEESHCIKSFERRLLWPDAKSLYIYPIKSFKGFEEPVLFRDGEIANYQPSPEEQKMIDVASELPKTIVIDNEAVCIGNNGFNISEAVKKNSSLKQILEAFYQKEILECNGDKSLPIYQLALVRSPKLIVKKKEVDDGGNMPWEIREEFEDCTGFAVVKIDDDSIAGCHETMEEAEAQLTALVLSEADEEESANDDEMSEEDEGKQEEGLEIAEGFAIINVESGEVVSCHPTQEQAEEQLEQLLTEAEEDESTIEEKAGKRLNSKMLKRLKEAWQTLKDLMAWGEYKEEKQLFDTDYGMGIKNVNGELWHFTWSTNAFEDRQEELFTTKALENYVLESSQKNDRGFFNFWHIPGTDFAEKQFQEVVGRFLVEAGPYLDTAAGRRAKEFFMKHKDSHPEIAPEGWGCSPEFKFLPEERGIGEFNWIWITRTSTLPKSAAANIWTETSQEVKMSTLTGERKEAAIALFGKDFVSNLEQEGEKRTEQLEDAGIAHKEENQEKKVEDFTLDDIVNAMAEKMEVDLKPIAEVLVTMSEEQKALKVELDQLKKQEEIKSETETPRWLFQVQRASEADKTKVADDDKLTEQKPKETNKQEVSVAGHFFTGG